MKLFTSVVVLALTLVAYDGFGQTYQLTDLGALMAANSYAQGINNQGQVVGYWNATNGAHAFLYQAGDFNRSNGSLEGSCFFNIGFHW